MFGIMYSHSLCSSPLSLKWKKRKKKLEERNLRPRESHPGTQSGPVEREEEREREGGRKGRREGRREEGRGGECVGKEGGVVVFTRVWKNTCLLICFKLPTFELANWLFYALL